MQSTGCVNFKKRIKDNQTIERIWLGVGLRRKGVAVKNWSQIFIGS
jgi:hypothetical protein